jgi:DNA-binding transcriptional regulator YiaG
MSTKSALMERLERLGPVRVESRRPLSSDEGELVLLRCPRDVGPLIPVAKRLREAGLTLRLAHAAINDLAEHNVTVCLVEKTCDMAALAADLKTMRVELRRRRAAAIAATEIVEVRARHALSQRDFADRLGIDVRTLQNWEQGRNRPDPAAMTLIRLFDRDPAAVLAAVFEAAE